jgi:hypothetical protein
VQLRRKVLMMHEEAGLVTLPLASAVLCISCETVSGSRHSRCGVCGSDAIHSLSSLLNGPQEPPPAAGAAISALVLVA